MKINFLTLVNVRNHARSSFELPDEVLFTGANGSGKTTVLEAIYLLLAAKGFRKQPISNIISFNQSFMCIEAETEENDLKREIKLKYGDKKYLLSDDIQIESISDYIFSLPIVCHTPDNPGILSKDHSDRRSFIDRFAFYAEKRHIDDIRLYKRLIAQKSAEIENFKPDITYINVLNEEITRLSHIISERRRNIIAEINENLKKLYEETLFKIEPVLISYKTNIDNRSLLKDEITKKRCDYGIHRDKMDMCLDGNLVEKFSSFGQKKTFSLLVLLSATKHIEEIRKISIMTLLDDFEAGLDINRATLLRERFSNRRQAVYTGVENIRLGFKNIISL